MWMLWRRSGVWASGSVEFVGSVSSGIEDWDFTVADALVSSIVIGNWVFFFFFFSFPLHQQTNLVVVVRVLLFLWWHRNVVPSKDCAQESCPLKTFMPVESLLQIFQVSKLMALPPLNFLHHHHHHHHLWGFQHVFNFLIGKSSSVFFYMFLSITHDDVREFFPTNFPCSVPDFCIKSREAPEIPDASIHNSFQHTLTGSGFRALTDLCNYEVLP